MRRTLAAFLAALVLVLSGCDGQGTGGTSELDIWVTSEENAQTYQELAEKWNEENPQKQIQLNVEVYSSQRIAGKLSRAASVGTSFSSDDVPDLVEIDYATFPQYVFQQTTDLYPLKNMLEKHVQQADSISGVTLYSSKGICFALPYHNQELLFCYRLDLAQMLPEFQERAESFEGILELGKEYAGMTGEPLLWVDYLGSETFMAVFAQAIQEAGSAQKAYDATVELLKQMADAGASGYLPSGDAYADTFQELMSQGELPCIITTQANLYRAAQSDEGICAQYGVLPLPSFRGIRSTVSAPTVGIAVPMSSEYVILARDFLEYCRFSEAAQGDPVFDLCQTGQGQDIAANLSEYYMVSGNFSAPAADDSLAAAEMEGYLADYSHDVLGIE